jgi:hypothetical protein
MIQKETLAILDKQNMDDRDLDFLFNAYHLLARSDYISSKICLLGACTAEALDNRTVIGSQSFRHNRSLQMDGRIIVNPDTLSLEVDRNKNVNLQDENSLMGTVGGFDFDILNKINSIIKQPADTMDYQASVKLYSDIVARFKEEHPKESDIQVFDKWLRQNDPITFIRVNVITHFLPEECKLRIGGFTKREPDYFVSYSDVTKVTDIEFPVPRQMKEAGSR